MAGTRTLVYRLEESARWITKLAIILVTIDGLYSPQHKPTHFISLVTHPTAEHGHHLSTLHNSIISPHYQHYQQRRPGLHSLNT
jgi:CRISPR/Cas system CMR subunit Cmr6 (Cas7 group RAMP superfamily)